MARPGTFKKGHKLAKGSNGQIRRDLTIELISQLNETLTDKNGINRLKLQVVVSNLIDQATEHVPILNAKGEEIGVEKGDLTAIIHIFDRLEGRPTQRAELKDDSHIVPEYRSLEDVRVFLLERGLDVLVRERVDAQRSSARSFETRSAVAFREPQDA